MILQKRRNCTADDDLRTQFLAKHSFELTRCYLASEYTLPKIFIHMSKVGLWILIFVCKLYVKLHQTKSVDF